VPAASASAGEPAPKKILGFEPLTWAKIIPLGLMFFCILFNYTILRDTKVRGCGTTFASIAHCLRLQPHPDAYAACIAAVETGWWAAEVLGDHAGTCGDGHVGPDGMA
jgi:hypothetical protein